MPLHLNKQWAIFSSNIASVASDRQTSPLTFHKDYKHYKKYFGNLNKYFGEFFMLCLLCHISSLNAMLTSANEENGRVIVTCLKHIVFRTPRKDYLIYNIVIGNGLYGDYSLELYLDLRSQYLFRIIMHKALF